MGGRSLRGPSWVAVSKFGRLAVKGGGQVRGGVCQPVRDSDRVPQKNLQKKGQRKGKRKVRIRGRYLSEHGAKKTGATPGEESRTGTTRKRASTNMRKGRSGRGGEGPFVY